MMPALWKLWLKQSQSPKAGHGYSDIIPMNILQYSGFRLNPLKRVMGILIVDNAEM